MSPYQIFLRIVLLGILWGHLPGCESKAPAPLKKTGADPVSTSIAKGQEAYLSYGCAVCHGREGHGDGLSAKKFYPPPIDFHDPRQYRHGHARQEMRNTIKFGVREEKSGMPAFEHIPDEELDQLVDFLTSLQEKKQ